MARFMTPVICALLSVLCLATPTNASTAKPPPGTVRVTIAAPAGIPANVALSGKTATYVATKPAAGKVTTVTIQANAGLYKVVADSMTIDGRHYVATSSQPGVLVKPGRISHLKVAYKLNDSVRDFHASLVDQTSVTLTWTAQKHTRIVVRRTGSVPAKTLSQGVNVPIAKGSAVDKGLKAGTEYIYSLFALYRGDWVGPILLRVGTASTDPSKATYVANPQTQILKNTDIATATPTGSGVKIALAAGRPTPVIGAAVVLPVSAALPGGYLGVATGVAADGRSVDLVAGGISDAFDYYEISIPEIKGAASAPSATAAATKPTTAKTAKTSDEPVSPKDRKPLPSSAAKNSSKASSAAALAAAASLIDCGGSAGQEISFAPKLTMGGHFNATISKYKILGKNIPTGATLDMSIGATLSGAATITTSAELSCGLDVDPIVQPIAVQPVPISIYLSPAATFTIGGKVEVSNLGVAATAGVKVAGHFGLTDGASFTGSPIFNAVPLSPKVVASGSIGLRLGGQLIVGPGAGTPKAGVIAGLGGDYYPLDASFGPVFPFGDPRFNSCLLASAAFTRSLSLTAKAWLGNWDISQSVTLDALKGETHYPGSPWYFPSGCKDAVSPGDTVLGDGVTKIGDSVTGGQNQWGYVPGLVPGKKTWVLSTGNIADVVGSPATFASTQLGEPGDDDLSQLAGHATFDAVAYTVKLVPTGSTLHVKYAFASEEYPEYVGSVYNDVMAVYVNGVNCATVPGGSTPVSVNTINTNLNSQYFVDNASGAAGYSTSMDGLTIPLECKVPVTVGETTTVKIAVADTSDRQYDSAVALLDQGIWSD
ncbi:choice-of-anchor L domain-containing protein [Acrocarpospora sp. B8E8]|uniref:choice-of-anchor L domain-containing protein n=1 Tax=Acrocarpospora sp. B8E8 TaxID=3153572 RepID=UPI00325E30A5